MLKLGLGGDHGLKKPLLMSTLEVEGLRVGLHVSVAQVRGARLGCD